jgi:hypothetical protein
MISLRLTETIEAGKLRAQVAINSEELRKRYASLSDGELLSINREDLTTIAQGLFDWELQKRGLHTAEFEGELEDETDSTNSRFSASTDELEDGEAWLENGFPVTVFSGTPAGAADAMDAHSALHSAGIPCEITEHDVDPADEPVPPPYKEYRVVVPAALSMQATSVLDKAIFNARLEADWKTQLESLSDEELSRLSVDALCGGLLDRVERLRRVYKAEVARRSQE